jgi:hypothetical protein
MIQVIQRFRLEGANGELIKGGEEYDRRHALGSAAADNFEAINSRHLNVEKHHLGHGYVESCEHLGAVAAFAGDGKLREGGQ